MKLDEYTEEALRFVNNLRQGWGQEPLDALPCGVPGDSTNCPVAKALGLPVGQTTIYPNHFDEIEIPERVQNFITLFDDEEYPELIERREGEAPQY